MTPSYTRNLGPFEALRTDLEQSSLFVGVLGDLSNLIADTVETDDAYTISIPVPGFRRGDVKLEVAHDGGLSMVAVRGEQKLERYVMLGDLPVDLAAISAKLEDGMLTITAPKAAAVKPRTIPIT